MLLFSLPPFYRKKWVAVTFTSINWVLHFSVDVYVCIVKKEGILPMFTMTSCVHSHYPLFTVEKGVVMVFTLKKQDVHFSIGVYICMYVI